MKNRFVFGSNNINNSNINGDNDCTTGFIGLHNFHLKHRISGTETVLSANFSER
jgi:hypothetical protein